MSTRPAVAAFTVALCIVVTTGGARAQESLSPDEIAEREAIRDRAAIARVHRAAGITTWFSLAATTTWGTLRYANVIGFGDPLCDPGGGAPIFGSDFGCGAGHRTWHLISASFSTLSYAVTRVLAALMPDAVDEAAIRSTGFGGRLAVHRALSWVHLAGMIAMPILGFLTSATSDRGDQATLATIHLGVGYATLAAVSIAAGLMVF